MMRRTPFPILPPSMSLAETCTEARQKNGTFMVINMKKLKEA
jgi:hypothetical protein